MSVFALLALLAGGALLYTLLCAVSWPLRRRWRERDDVVLVTLILATAPRSRRQALFVTQLGTRRLDAAVEELRRRGLVLTATDRRGEVCYRLRAGAMGYEARAAEVLR